MTLKKLKSSNNRLDFKKGFDFGLGFFFALLIFLIVMIPILACLFALLFGAIGKL